MSNIAHHNIRGRREGGREGWSETMLSHRQMREVGEIKVGGMTLAI